jgi:hypothetical protein
MLASAAPSREVLVALAALCARLGDPAAAAEHLRRAAVAAGEPARHLWAGGRRAWGERAARLGVALDARVAGDAVPGGAARPLETARRAFGAARALARGNAADPRRRQELGRTVRAALGELGTGPLLGDALFFRALAALALAPDQAANDLRTLLARRAWIEREARAGSTRPQAVGDALLRLGQAAEAARSYRAARSPGVGERATAEREAVARVVQAIAEAKGPTEIGAAFTEAERGAPDSAWTATLAAFGLLAAGDPAAAAARLDEATARGAPSPVVAALAVLVESVRGGVALPPGVGAALRLPAVVATGLAFLAGVDGTEPEPLLQDLELKMTPALARRLLRHLCDQGRWPEARAHAARLAAVGEAWAGDLAALVRLRHALHLAASGDLDGADRELAAVDRATATYLSTQKGPP